MATGTEGPAKEKPTQAATPESLKVLIDTTPFHIIFQGTPQTRTTSVSSDDLKAALVTPAKVSEVPLKTVRDSGELPKAYLFCINGTNIIKDKTLLGKYISLTKDNITALQNAATDASNPAILTVQYISRHRPPPPEIPKPPTLTESPKDDGKIPVIADKAPVAVNIATTGLVAGSGGLISTHPAEMTDKQWNYVMITNSLLHGMFLDQTSYTFQKARHPAFKLKKSFPDPLHTGATSTISDQVCIPAFEVNDDSSVTITEVKTPFELSMAQHALNSLSVAASVSGGFGGYSVGASASASWSSSHGSASKLAKTMDILHASYNFPRVKVFLDSDDLEITNDCQTLLDTIRNPADVATFYRKYGHIFLGSVQLGGRLQTTKESTSTDETKFKEQKDSLKVAAAASFSSPFVSGWVSAAHAESLAWEAQGGETLLGTNPPAWINSVGSFYNWRVMQRNDPQDILSLLKRISNKDWPTIFAKIESVQDNPKDILFRMSGAERDRIQIKNMRAKRVRVAVSNATLTTESARFLTIDPGQSLGWTRTGKECVFINEDGSGRVVIAMAYPGMYEIKKLDSDSVNQAGSYTTGLDKYIGVKNNTDDTLQVFITWSGTSAWFYPVLPKTTERWSRSEFETIFVQMHPSSSTLLTYFGEPGRDFQFSKPGHSVLHNFHLLRDVGLTPNIQLDGTTLSAISIFNEQSLQVNAKVSNSSSYSLGSENFFTIAEEHQHSDCPRKKMEVIYLNGPHGTAVGAYAGIPGRTLVVNHPISYDGK